MAAAITQVWRIPRGSFTGPRWRARYAAPAAFFAVLVVLSSIATWCLWRSLPIAASNVLTGAIWTAGFFALSLNTSYMLLTALISSICPSKALPETHIAHSHPCDLVFVVKDEPAEVLANMEVSLRASFRPGIRLVLISNSMNQVAIKCETAAINRLRMRFGEHAALHWRPLHNPSGRKHTALQQWFREGPAGAFCFLCDADTVVPAGAIDRLLGKAQHPANNDIAVFQAQVRIGNVATRFAKFLQFGTELSQRVHMTALQRVFGSSPFFGHGALIRRDAFAWIRLPPTVLSHDIWEMALLGRRDWRVAYCPDVYTIEEFPAHYLEAIRRDRRWAEGTLQSARVLFLSGLSPAGRFFVAHAIYTYISQLLFLAWLLLGFLMSASNHASIGTCLQPLSTVGAGAIVLDGGSMYLPVLLVVWLHRLPFCRGWREVVDMIRELGTSTVIFLNSMVYTSIAILLTPFGKRVWIPMRKGTNSSLTVQTCFTAMAPSFGLGLVLLTGAACFSPGWLMCAAPILTAFVFGPIAVWVTSMPLRKNGSPYPIDPR